MADALIQRKIQEGSTLTGEEIPPPVGPFVAHGGAGIDRAELFRELTQRQEEIMKQLFEAQNEIIRKLQKRVRYVESLLKNAQR